MANLKKKPSPKAALNHEGWLAATANLIDFCCNGGQGPRFQSQPSPTRLCVGFSAGLDSSVLLHWLSQQQTELGFSLSAVHIHHGLSPNADIWAEHARAFCQAHQIPCQITHVNVSKGTGLGVESNARTARYRAFSEQACEAIVLAHHQNDQSETLLINLLRGSGPAGLSAMKPVRALNAHIDVLRPLLQLPRSALLDYANAHQLTWVEDESNQNTAFKRNKIRHELIPLLEGINPKAIATIARSAIHQGDAAAILLERAQEDLVLCVQDQALQLAPFQQLSAARQRNALHHWLDTHGITLELRAFDELLRVTFDAASDTCPALVWRNAAIRRYRGALHITRASLNPGPQLDRQWQDAPQIADWHGELRWIEAEHGIDPRFLQQGYRIAGRSGGESLRLAANRPTRSLKAHCQVLGIAPWLRETTPLIYLNGQLAAVPGLGVHADFQVAANQIGWLPIWQANHPNMGIAR